MSENTAVADVYNVDAVWNALKLPERRSLFSFGVWATLCWCFSLTRWPSGRTAKFLFGTSKPGTIIQPKILENNGFHVWKDKLIYMSILNNRTHSCHTRKGGAPIWTHPQHQSVQLRKMRSWEWRPWLEGDGKTQVIISMCSTHTLQQKHLVLPFHLKLTFHFWMKEGPQICFLGFTVRYLLFDFTRSIYSHLSCNFLFEITANCLQTYDETSEDQANASSLHWHRRQWSSQCSRN